MKIVRKILIMILLLAIIQISSAQDSYIKDRLNIKAGYARYGGFVDRVELKNNNFRAECNYGFLDYMEGGIYAGIFKVDVPIEVNGSFYSDHRRVVSYGLNANFHFLPLFVDAKDLRMDLYLAGKYGLRSMINPQELVRNKFFPEYGVGAGFAFYPWKHLGLYTEFSIGKFEYNTTILKDRINMRYGLSFKF